MAQPIPRIALAAAWLAVGGFLGNAGIRQSGSVFAAKPHGEEVQWRTDYNAARIEAQKTGLPIVIDFSTDWCVHCKKLDVTTFRDPAVAACLNGNFIPLKLDGDKEKRLVEALRIQGYPTLILAGPDGRILKTIEGYRDAARFREDLQEVLAALSNPDWMNRNYQDAARSAQAGDFAAAAAMLHKIIDDARQKPIHWQARILLQDIERQAQLQLGRAKRLEEAGLWVEAAAAYAETMRVYAGTGAAADAARLLAAAAERPEVKDHHRRRRAAQLLAQAHDNFRDKNYFGCLESCETLVAEHADLPEAVEARQMLREIKGNPELLKIACDRTSDRLADLYLTQAEAWVLKGEMQLAVDCFKKVESAMPGTRQAEIAKVRLAQIQVRPVLREGPDKP